MIKIKFLILLLFSMALLSACNKENKTKENKAEKNNGNVKVYESPVDLKKVDKNEDGKVYQCTMHPNCLSDSPGKCPKCDMKLTETSMGHAARLLHHEGFQTK